MPSLIGNTNSPVRSLARDATGNLLRVRRGEGSYLHFENGKKMLDFVLGYGCLPFGHAFPPLVETLQKTLSEGSSYGVTSEREEMVAEKILNSLSLDNTWKIRMTNSGSEATTLAIRLAQKQTKKKKFLRFTECYHGWNQLFFDDTGIIASFNDIESVKEQIQKHKGEISAIILEPVGANYGLRIPKKDFFTELEAVCREENILLIFDEVIMAYRLHFGGAFSYFGITPDIIIFGKMLSGGYPFGAVVGKEKIMNHLAPNGDLFHAGTFHGNTLICDTIFFTLEYLEQHFEKFEQKQAYLKNIPKILSCGSIFSVQTENEEEYKNIYLEALKKGIFLSPSRDEVSFLSLSHTEKEIEKLREVFS